MVNQEFVKWLVDRIRSGKINPVTNEPFKLEDIKMQEYKDAVANEFKAEGNEFCEPS